MRLALLAAIAVAFLFVFGCAGPDNGINANSTAPTDLAISAVSDGQCTVGEHCSVVVAEASGGHEPYTFQSDSFATGAPPMGMIVNMDGTLTGTPSIEGTYDFGVCVKDATSVSKCTSTSVLVNPEAAPSPPQPPPNNDLDEHGCNVAEGESWCGITQECMGWDETCEAAKPPPQKESWSGTVEGTYETHDGNYAPCIGDQDGGYSESFTLSFTTDSGLADALQDSSSNGASGTGTFSGKETILRQPPESYCQLQPSSASTQVTVDASFDSFSQKNQIMVQPDGANSLWASSSFLSGTQFLAPQQQLIMHATSVSPTQISGDWHTYPFGAEGTFTLHKAG